MKHFMIKYQFANGTPEEWHREIGRFIAAINSDPELKGQIIYRCLKNRDDSSYFHFASAADDAAVKTLQSRDFFKHYNAQDPPGCRRRRGHGHADRTDRGDRGGLTPQLSLFHQSRRRQRAGDDGADVDACAADAAVQYGAAMPAATGRGESGTGAGPVPRSSRGGLFPMAWKRRWRLLRDSSVCLIPVRSGRRNSRCDRTRKFPLRSGMRPGAIAFVIVGDPSGVPWAMLVMV